MFNRNQFVVLTLLAVLFAVTACREGDSAGVDDEADAEGVHTVWTTSRVVMPAAEEEGPPQRSSPGLDSLNPPCTAMKAPGNVCVTRDVSAYRLFLKTYSPGVAGSTGEGLSTVEDVLESGLKLAEASPVQLAFRGTASADSVRCSWRGIARTAMQREQAIRFWLGMDLRDPLPGAGFLETLFRVTLDTLNPEFRATAKSNFLAIARGGLTTEYLFLTCYAGCEWLPTSTQLEEVSTTVRSRTASRFKCQPLNLSRGWACDGQGTQLTSLTTQGNLPLSTQMPTKMGQWHCSSVRTYWQTILIARVWS